MAAAVVGAACVPRSGSIRLASIHQLETREIIVGEEFKVFGDGFVPGDVEIVLDGSWLVPGEPARRMTLAFSGNAVTEREISTVLPVETFREVGAQHALFEGDVHARFATSRRVRMGYIEAVRSRVVLDVLADEPGADRRLGSLSARTDQFLETMGVAGESDPEGGFQITAVTGGAAAARAGVEAGDVVRVSRGMRVLSELDLLPAPGERSTRWIVARDDESGTPRLHSIDIPLPHDAASSGPEPVWFVAAAAAALMALLSGEVMTMLLLPFTLLRRGLSALAARWRRRRDRIVSLADEPAEPADRIRWTQSLLALPVVLAAASGCAAVVFTAGGRLHAGAAYVVLVALAWLTGFRASRSAAGTAGTLARRFTACLLAPAPVAFIFIWRGLFTLRPSLAALAGGQELAPWTWHGLGDPFAFVILAVAVLAAGLPERRDVTLGRYLAHQLYTVVVCAVVAHVMLGGLAPLTALGSAAEAQATALGLLVWVAKVLALYLLVQARDRDRPARTTSDLWIVLGRPALLTGALVGSVMLGPTMQASVPSLPHVTAAAGGVLVLLTATGAGRARETAAIRLRPW